MQLSKANRYKISEVIALFIIIGLGAYFRLHNLTDYPGWYSDEGSDLNIIANLLSGRIQYLALKDSLLIAGRLPLIYYLIKPFGLLFGNGIGLIRGFTVACGIVSIPLLYVFIKTAAKDLYFAFASALIYAIYPNAIFYSRIGFLYNFLTPLLLATLIGLWSYLQTERILWLLLTSFFLGVSLASEIAAWAWLPIFILIVLAKSPASALKFTALSMIPVFIEITWMLVTSHDAFLYDLKFTLGRLSTPLLIQIIRIFHNFSVLTSSDIWWVAGWIGLFILPNPRLRNFLVLTYFATWVVAARSVSLSDIGTYYAIPLFIFVAMGVSGLIRYGIPLIVDTFRTAIMDLASGWGKRMWSGKSSTVLTKLSVVFSALALSVFISPLFVQIYKNHIDSSSGYHSKIDPILIDPGDAIKVAEYISENRTGQELIIGSPAFIWQLPNNVSDFQLSLIAKGIDTYHLPGGIPRSRFVYDTRLEMAQFVVIDPIWRNWAAVNMPEVKELMEYVERNWKSVFQSGDLLVYENPAN